MIGLYKREFDLLSTSSGVFLLQFGQSLMLSLRVSGSPVSGHTIGRGHMTPSGQ